MTEFTPLPALAGGVLIGLSGALMLLGMGRMAGVSGIIGSAIREPGAGAWRWCFLAGLMLGAAVYVMSAGTPVVVTIDASTATLVVGGLLVGIGTRMGGGCTSGHGVCGLSRLSLRSLVAVPVFMLSAGVVVFVVRHVPGVGG